MSKQSKRYRALAAKAPATAVPLAKAVEVLKQFGTTKFDQTVDQSDLGARSQALDGACT